MFYKAEDHGIREGVLQTREFQKLIDEIHEKGGGTIVLDRGNYFSGALFFRPGVNFCIRKKATLYGSEDTGDYPILKTRIEGQTRDYTVALINADGCNGFRLYGKGSVDGQGLHTWEKFWEGLKADPAFRNTSLSRPRILYVSNSSNVRVSGISFRNSPFWTTHFHRCSHLKIQGCSFFSPNGTRPGTKHGRHRSGCRFRCKDNRLSFQRER